MGKSEKVCAWRSIVCTQRLDLPGFISAAFDDAREIVEKARIMLTPSFEGAQFHDLPVGHGISTAVETVRPQLINAQRGNSATEGGHHRCRLSTDHTRKGYRFGARLLGAFLRA
jgi:hypothetical protein